MCLTGIFYACEICIGSKSNQARQHALHENVYWIQSGCNVLFPHFEKWAVFSGCHSMSKTMVRYSWPVKTYPARSSLALNLFFFLRLGHLVVDVNVEFFSRVRCTQFSFWAKWRMNKCKKKEENVGLCCVVVPKQEWAQISQLFGWGRWRKNKNGMHKTETGFLGYSFER